MLRMRVEWNCTHLPLRGSSVIQNWSFLFEQRKCYVAGNGTHNFENPSLRIQIQLHEMVEGALHVLNCRMILALLMDRWALNEDDSLQSRGSGITRWLVPEELGMCFTGATSRLGGYTDAEYSGGGTAADISALTSVASLDSIEEVV